LDSESTLEVFSRKVHPLVIVGELWRVTVRRFHADAALPRARFRIWAAIRGRVALRGETSASHHRTTLSRTGGPWRVHRQSST